jgi:hypothetical protein
MSTSVATRYRCSLRQFGSCVSGPGQPKTKKCRFCGAVLTIEQGRYHVFVWRGDGRYNVVDSKRSYVSEAAANRFIVSDEKLVVRWISGGLQ